MMRFSKIVAVIVLAGIVPLAEAKLPAQAAAAQAPDDGAAARDGFERTLASNPQDVPAQEGEVRVSERMALAARAAGDMDAALEDLLRAQKFVPENARLLYDLGVLEDELHLYRDADATLTHLKQIDSANPRVLYAVARVKLDLGQFAAAEQNMEAYLKIRPEDATAHYGLGRIFRQSLELDKAKVEFERSIELTPVQTEAYYQLGDTELAQQDYGGALANFSKTLERDPKHGGALAGTGIAYFKQKRYDQAAEFLERATQAAPDYQPGHYYLGLTLGRLGRADDSQRELAIAARLADENNRAAANRLRLNTPAVTR